MTTTTRHLTDREPLRMQNRLLKYGFKLLTKLLVTLLCFTTVPSSAIETITYYHTDGLGSPVAGTDSSGALLWKEDYKPYGERIRKQVESDKNTRWYTGHPEDKETGLTYAGARFYDSITGRFLAVDPVGFSEDNLQIFNRYAYGNNNPYKYIDPDGRNPETLLMFDQQTYMEIRGLELGVDASTGVGRNAVLQQMQTEALYEAGGLAVGAAVGKVIGNVMGKLSSKRGLTTPKKFFGNKTKPEVKDALGKKFGPPKSSRDNADTYYNPKSKRSFNVHEEPGHNAGKPHVDIRRRGGYQEKKYDLKDK